MADLLQRLAGLSPEERSRLERALIDSRNGLPLGRSIPRRTRDGARSLSHGQRRLWFLDQLEPGEAVYNVPVAMRVAGNLDAVILERALDILVQRHEVLRTVFVHEEGEPVQAVANLKPVLHMVDLRAQDPQERERELQRQLMEESRRPFDLSRDTVLRAVLFSLQDDQHVLLLVVHHIASDGWSMGIMLRELSAVYESLVVGREPDLPELPIQYGDYAEWQQQWMQSEECTRQISYWRGRLRETSTVIEIPGRRPLGALPGNDGGCERALLPRELLDDIKSLGRKEGCTLFMTLMAAFQVLLYRYSGQESFIVGTPIAGRMRPETEGLVGFFVNTLPIDADLSGGPTFLQLLARVRQTALEAFAHQELPFEKIVEDLHPGRTERRSPLVQVMFILQSGPRSKLELPGMEVTPVEIHPGTAKFDVTLETLEQPDGLLCRAEYRTDLLDAPAVARMLGHYQVLLEAMVADPNSPVSALPVLTERERHQVLVEWNYTQAAYPGESCIHDLFDEQARATPNATAVIEADGRLTYRELECRSNQLAHHLVRLGVRPDAVVGLCLRRSLDAYVAALGILKAGGAYLPLDPAYPSDRLAFMLEDARPLVVVTQRDLLERLPAIGTATICVDSDRNRIAQEPTEGVRAAATPDDLAYVIYTSGSTGRPKGVMGLHRGAVNRFHWMWRAYPFGVDEVCCQKTALSFVDSVWEMFGPLLRGIPTVIIPDEDVRDPERLVRVLGDRRVSRIVLVPSLLRSILENSDHLQERLPQLKICVSSGEALPLDLAARFAGAMPHCLLLNLYGSSEVSADVTCYEVGEVGPDSPSVPIGRPIANTRIYLLDRHRAPVPVGLPGELYAAGDGLARGYLYRPDLTTERFVADPFSGTHSSRLYRTGDRARYLPDGNIEFLGRIDHQVKVRGNRIELGEIESQLHEHPAVTQSVVLLVPGGGTGDRLIAYFVGREGQETEPSVLRDHLKARLPDYMLPSAFVQLERFPLTPNGKVDRVALAAIDPATHRAERIQCQPPDPRDGLELQMLRLWEKVLGLKSVGLRDDFFDIGGHSLLAVQLFAEIERAFGKRVPLSTLFEGATVESLAELIRSENCGLLRHPLVPIQPLGTQSPLFVVHGLNGEVLHYQHLARRLGEDQPVYGLQSRWKDGRQVHGRGVKEMAADYVEEMRTIQPEGPYLLAGHSGAGLVAYEMSVLLSELGEQVDLLVLFDTGRSNYSRHLGPHERMLRHAVSVWRLPMRQKLEYVSLRAAERIARTGARIQGVSSRWTTGGRRNGPPLVPRAMVEAERENLAAFMRYVPRPYPGRITLFWASDTSFFDHLDRDPRTGWGELTRGGVEIIRLPGSHVRILDEPYVEHTAEILAGILRSAQAHKLE